MTRKAFRGEIEIPRPPAAFVMSLVACASLWITGELALWMIPVQLLAHAVAYHTRASPPAWRRSPIWLNVGMAAITGVTIAQALRGSPATLSLAYFAGLCQGLQLLDARPRKSEFLLVALALFQVVLAANLTDSVFFPPLLVLFLVSVTWTLLVHTLRMEAAEAGDVNAAGAVFTQGLARTTLFATAASIALALVLFTILPRMRSSVFRGVSAPGISLAGFDDRVELGAIGQIRHDGTVVLRVRTLSGEAPSAGSAYFRGLAFDHFDGRSWSISPVAGRPLRRHVSGSPRFGIDLAGGPPDDALVQSIVREPVQAGVLFGAGRFLRIEGPLDRLERDANDGVYLPGHPDDRIRYTLWTAAGQPTRAQLDADRTKPPEETGPAALRSHDRYLALPAALDPRVGALAEEIVRGLRTDAARLAAIETYLREHGRYTDSPPDMGLGGALSPVEEFLLGDLAGHCEYFASAMVVLSRSLGIPTRLVNGFAGGSENGVGGFTELTRSDAHAWLEAHYAEAGWVRYDPTPPDLRLRPAAAPTLGARLAELASAIELWWFQRVVDFDSADQILALKSVWSFVRTLRLALASGSAPARHAAMGGLASPGDARASPTAWAAPAFLGLAGLVVVTWLVRRRGQAMQTERMPVAYRRALRLLSRRGLRRAPSTTARGFAGEVARVLPAEAAFSFARLTEAYLAERFGRLEGKGLPQDPESELRRLRAALRRSRGGTRAQSTP